MAKSTQAGRLRGPGAAGGAGPGTVEQVTAAPVEGERIGGFVSHLQIASRSPAGFRRCGRRWGPAPVEVPIDDFSEAQLEQILTEPELIVLAVTDGTASDDE